MEVTHQQPTLCFSPFSPFLQEITNTNVLGHENKENIPPALFGKSHNEGGSGCKSGWKNGGITQLLNNSLNSCCCTPVTNRQRAHHTGLTPGNKCAAGPRGVSTLVSTNTNIVDVSLITESDAGDLKESNFFITPVKRWDGGAGAGATTNAAHAAATPCFRQGKLCELFNESVSLPLPVSTPNVSVESTLLPRSVLLESDDDDSVKEVQTIKKPCVSEAPRSVVPRQLGLRSSQEDPSQQRPVEGQKAFPASASMHGNAHPAPQHHAVQHSGPPPAYPRHEKRQNVTRVVGKTASLIAVGGRRVPIDKLHLLLRPATSEGKSGTKVNDSTTGGKGSVSSSAFDPITPAPLAPSLRPTPTAAKAVKVVAPPAAAPAPLIRRSLPVHQHCDYVILEFARGVVMRLQVDSPQPLPVIGRRYLAAIKSSRSPYDNVAYEDAGVCVYLQRHHGDANTTSGPVQRSALYDGTIIREVGEHIAADAARLQELKKACNNAIVECRKQFRFLNLPFELVDVCYTFDRSICIVYYNIQPQEGTSSQPNVSRLLRMLQFNLRTKVFLKGITSGE
ncbi:putative ESAG8-associated protein [Trypanosoma cruzi]|uniref:Putative ESAG8-associated protein n=1 Tax=Trypanosoma cruzi TaxID=5693 RepID=A0A2V2VLF4_TRYCR|nr:putative ESAG8-associated protein [Trypanosoma cruzi]